MPRQLSTQTLRTLVPLLIAAVLIACGGSSKSPAPTKAPAAAGQSAGAAGTAVSAADLVGTTWQALAFGSSGNSMPIDKSTPLTLNFGIKRYAGSGGCNWFLGTYMVNGSQMNLYTPSETALQCTQPANVMQQESTYTAALQNITQFRKSEDKLLGYTTGNQLLLTFGPVQPVPLENTTWSMKFQLNKSDAAPIATGTTITVTFAGGQITGNAGCNNYTGSYTLNGQALTISNLAAATKNTCSSPQGVMNQEALYLTNLASAVKVVQSGNVLQLLNKDDETVLLYGVP